MYRCSLHFVDCKWELTTCASKHSLVYAIDEIQISDKKWGCARDKGSKAEPEFNVLISIWGLCWCNLCFCNIIVPKKVFSFNGLHEARSIEVSEAGAQALRACRVRAHNGPRVGLSVRGTVTGRFASDAFFLVIVGVLPRREGKYNTYYIQYKHKKTGIWNFGLFDTF